MVAWPQRIVCLTEETVETLYLLGCLDRVVGVSGFAVRPPQVRRIPRVGVFLEADIPRILELKPDLVLCFSDLQAGIAAALLRAGVEVVGFNQRTLAEVYRAMLVTGAVVGKSAEAELLVGGMQQRVDEKRQAATGRRRLRVYFEEWMDPLISAIGWVHDLMDVVGADNVFAGRAEGRAARDRVVQSQDVVNANPEVIIGSWCGRMFKPQKVAQREGWQRITAVERKALYEVKSTIILQPGPAALTDGLDALEAIMVRESMRAGG